VSSDLVSCLQAIDEADSASALQNAVESLAALEHPESIPTLIQVLRYNNPGAAVAAVSGLVKMGEAAVQPILDNLDDHNYTARAWATRALAEIGDPRALEILLAAAETDFSPSVRRAAVKGLGCLRWCEVPEPDCLPFLERVVPVLAQNAQDPEWVVRYGAIAGIEALLRSPAGTYDITRTTFYPLLLQLAAQDPERAVMLRSQLAIERLGNQGHRIRSGVAADAPSP
jgi:phycocyanobilin lyase beta subunit